MERRVRVRVLVRPRVRPRMKERREIPERDLRAWGRFSGLRDNWRGAWPFVVLSWFVEGVHVDVAVDEVGIRDLVALLEGGLGLLGNCSMLNV